MIGPQASNEVNGRAGMYKLESGPGPIFYQTSSKHEGREHKIAAVKTSVHILLCMNQVLIGESFDPSLKTSCLIGCGSSIKLFRQEGRVFLSLTNSSEGRIE